MAPEIFQYLGLNFLHQLKLGTTFDFEALRKIFFVENQLSLIQLNSNLAKSVI